MSSSVHTNRIRVGLEVHTPTRPLDDKSVARGVFTRAFHGSGQFSRVGSGRGDQTRPDPTRETSKPPDSNRTVPSDLPTRPDSTRMSRNLLTRLAGRVMTREKPWYFTPYHTKITHPSTPQTVLEEAFLDSGDSANADRRVYGKNLDEMTSQSRHFRLVLCLPGFRE